MSTKYNIDTKAIGQRIRRERELLGLSREDLAELLELSDYYVGQLERGERQMSLPVLVNVSNCLHVSLDYLVFGEAPVPFEVKDGRRSYAADHGETLGVTSAKSCRAELEKLLEKCTERELELVKKLVQTILPYLHRSE